MNGSCANPACACEARPDDRYCGGYCANVTEHEREDDAACACGHDACVQAQRVAKSPDEPHTSVGPHRDVGPDEASPGRSRGGG